MPVDRNPLRRILRSPLRIAEVARLVLFWVKTYFGAQAGADPARAEIVEKAVDDRIAPDERAIYPYLFAAIYILYIGWHMLDRLTPDQYRAARAAFRDMIREAEKVFLARPTRMRGRDRLKHPLTRLMTTIDGATCCFPSLHVALVMFSYQLIKDDPGADPLLVAAFRASCIDIARATLETKQHSVVDVLGGIVLSRQIYRRNFAGPFEDLAAEVLPELTAAEMARVQALIAEPMPLLELLDRLLEALP